MTLVTATVEDVHGGPDNSVWIFSSLLRESSDGNEIVTPKTVRVTPVDGVLSITLDPGYSAVAYRGKEYVIEVPDSGTADLWDLISASVAFPPGTPPELVGQAVLAWLSTHTEETFAGLGASDVGLEVITAVDEAAGRDALYVLGPMHTLPHGKLKGANIVPKPAATGGGSTGPAALWAEWDWNNWIKPQIDRAVALGLNAIRINGAPQVALVRYSTDIPKLSQATLNARWEQLASYCLEMGLYLYPTLVEKFAYMYTMFGGLGGTAPWDWQDETVTDLIVSNAAVLAKYPNVVGFDIFQEGGGSHGDGLTAADVLVLYAAIREVAPGIPLTTSDSSGSFASASEFWNNTTSMSYQLWTYGPGGADFVDLHIYMDGVVPGDLDGYIARTNLPIIFGEYGASQSQTTDYRTALYTGVKNLHNRPGVLGSFLWALADQGTADAGKYGIWNNTGFFQPTFPFPAGVTPLSSASGQRNDMVTVLRGFAVAELPTLATLPNQGLYQPQLSGVSDVAQSGELRFYNTTDEATNYERARHRWNSNVYTIDIDAAGTGTFRNLRLAASGSFIDVDSNGLTVSKNATTVGRLLRVTSTGLQAASGSQAALLVDPTINQSGTADYTGLRVNVTETATGSGAKLLADLQLGGTSKFHVDSAGNTTALGALDLGHASDTTVSRASAGQIAVEGVNVPTVSSLDTLSNKTLASPAITGTVPVSSGGEIRLHNTSDQTTNYERLVLRVSSNIYRILSESGGTGTVRDIVMGAFGTIRSYGAVQGPATGCIDIAANTSAATATVAGVNGALSLAGAGTQYGLSISPTLTQSSTAGYVALLINPTETSVGSGAKSLILAQVGGVNKFAVDNSGNALVMGTLDVGATSDTTVSRLSAGQLGVEGNPIATKVAVPANASAAGVVGQYAVDASFHYDCIATNTWVRSAVATW